MKIISTPRAGGKTTQLIKFMVENPKVPIGLIVRHYREREYIQSTILPMFVKPQKTRDYVDRIFTFDDLKRGDHIMRNIRYFLLDDADRLIQDVLKINIIGASLTDETKPMDNPHISEDFKKQYAREFKIDSQLKKILNKWEK